MGYDMRYIPRTTIKSQAHTNFVAEWIEVQLPTPNITHEYWTMYFDGSMMVPGSRAGVVLISPDGSKLCYAIRLHFSASNNTAEYEALINELCICLLGPSLCGEANPRGILPGGQFCKKIGGIVVLRGT